jgi:RND family efflux transporter MFP subunit
VKTIRNSTKTQARINCALVALGALSALALSACHRGAAPTAALPLVVAYTVRAADAADGESLRYPCEVAARYSNAVSFRVPGKLVERLVRLGDRVRRGALLAKLDAADAERQSRGANAALEAAEHRLVFARQQLDRAEIEATANLIATAELEQAQDAFAAALAGRDEAAAQAAVAANNLGYQSLVADHDGVITSENADTGQVVAAGQPVFGLAWSGEVDATLDVGAETAAALAAGRPATVSFPALPGRSYAARVREIGPAADPGTRTYHVKLTLANAGPEVRLGLTGDAIFARDAGPATADVRAVVPATSLFHQGAATAVWVIRPGDGTLEARQVSVGTYRERTAVVTSGLNEGDVIVAAGVHTVYAGEAVKATTPLFAPPSDAGRVAGGP